MPLHNTDSLIIETDTAAESLPDPTTVNGRTHRLQNTGTVTVVWSSIGATPFSISGVNVATISIPRGQNVLVQSDGVRWVVFTESLVPLVTTPVRALNTPFTPNLLRPVLGLYTVAIQGQTSLLAGDEGRIELRADPGAPVTPRASMRNRTGQALGVTIGTVVAVETELVFLFPAGWQGTLATVVIEAAPTFTFIRGTEIVL